jgi:hypothetical protein
MALWTSRETAAHLRISERELARKRRTGKGPRFMRLGDEKTVRYDPPDVEEWLETLKVSSTSEEVAAGRRFHKVRPEIEPGGGFEPLQERSAASPMSENQEAAAE